MKKFMIFLLMAFLYLGTCQARSEATHFNNANVKLHSWVMPATSHAFIMDSKSVYGEPIVKVSPSQPQNLCLTCPLNKATFAVSFEENGSGESEASRVWLVNGHPTDSTGTTFTFSGYAAGHYTVACRVTTDAGYTYTSNYVEITVDVDAIVNIVGPDQACLNDVVTLTAQVENSSLECSYQWRRDGQYIVGATNPSYSFLVSELPGLTDTLVYEFDVQITRAGCDSKYSPVHYFMVAPTPVPQVDVPLFCAGSPVTLTGNAYTAGSIQPYMWKWINTTTNDTTVTYVNTVTIANPTSGDVYKVIPIYQDYACNADTAEVTLVSYQDSLHITELQDLTLIATPDTVCLDGMAQLKVNDPNKTNAALGEVSYTWYMNGTPVSGVTDSIYTATLSNTGTYTFKAVASYANYPCATAEDTVEVVVDTVPASVVITGNNILCQSGDAAYNSTTLTAEVTPSTGTYQYKWTGDSDFSTENTKEISLPGVYAVIVKTAGGCETMSLPIQVYGFGADVQITSTQTTCAGQPVTLNVNADGWTSNVTYRWDNGQTTSTINVTPTVDTWYKVTSTAHLTNGTTCTRTDSIQVLVLSAPTAPEVATKDNTICQDSLVTIYVKNAVDGTHYTWYQNGIELPGFNLDTISVELNTPGTYTFAAAVVSPNGCVSPASTAVTITVEAAPTLLTITGTDVICEGSQATLTAHAEGVAANDPYVWSTSDKTNEIQVGAGTYAVTAYSDNGCAVSAEYTVHSLGSDVQLTASTTEVCAGQSVTLNVNVDGWGEGNISYEWAGVTNGAHSNHVTVTPTESGYYKVTTTVTSTAGTCSRVDSIYITVIKVSVSDVAFIGPDTICVGSQATMTAVSNGANYFVWYENGVQIPGENLDTIRVMPTEPGSYIYSVAAVSNGCVSKDTTLQPELLVLGNPTVEITGDPIICNDSTIHLIAIINDTLNTNANGASYTYEWRLYNNTLTNGSNTVDGVDYDFVINNDTLETEVHSQDHPYIFTVTAYNENGCAATSEPYNVYVGNDIEVAVTVDRDTVCKGGMVTATAHLGDYNMSNLVYNWYIVTEAAGYTDTTWIADATSITYTASVEENLKIGVKVTQTTTGCTIMGDTTVTVFNPEIISVIVSNETFNDGSDFTVCEGEEVYVTAYIEDETTGAKIIDSSLIYVWYENGILLQGVDGPTFHKQLSILDEDTANYVYSVFIDFGVEGCLPKPVASNKVHVNRNPIVTIAGHHNVCYFGPYEETGYHNVHLIAWVNGDYNPDFTYTWYEHGQERYSVAGSIYDNHYTETWIPTFDNPHVFTVMVSDSNGCTTLSEPFEVNVYNKPVVNITASETTICDGGQSILTAHLDNYNDPNLIYQWYTNTTEPDNMIPGMTELTETFMPEDTTTYIIKVTHLLENGTLNAQACFSLATMTINVNDDPVIDSVTSDLAEGNDTICEGRYVTFTAHISGGVAGGEIFTWYRNGEIIPGAVDSVYRETPQAVNGDITVYDYAVSVRQTASGCESNVTPADTITVYPNPVLVLVTDPIVCDTMTDNIVMYANVTPAPTSSYNFTWYEDNAEITDGTLSGTHNDTIKITRPYRDYEYSFAVELVNDYGCTVRDEATVHVNDNPIVHATVTEDSICVGGQITLTANLDDYNADMLEFHWYDNGQLIGTATELTYTTVPTIGEHRYNMTALQRNSLCIASSDTVVVLVKPDPVISQVVLSDYIACEGAQVRVEAIADSTTYTPSATDVYTWYRNGIRIPGATNRVLFDTPVTVDQNTQQFVYTAVVTLEEPGCTSLPVSASALTIYRNPVVAISGDQHVCETDYTFLIANVDTVGMNVGNLHYTWFINGDIRDNNAYNLGDNRFFAEYLYPRDEPYIFTVTVERGDIANACASTSAPYEVYVYPKPEVNITGNVTDICENGAVTLQANLNDYNADNMTFQWYEVRNVTSVIAIDYLPGGGYVYDTIVTQYNYNIPGATGFRYTTTLTETTTLGVIVTQTTSQCYDIDEFTVTVHPTPPAPIIAVNHEMICSNGDVDLTITNDYSEYGTPIYAWMMDGQIIPGAFGPAYHQEPGLTSGTIHSYNAIVAFEMPGCISVASDTAEVHVIPDPVVTVTVDGPTTICEGGSVTFSANAQPTTLDYTYDWYDYNNQLIADAHDSTLTVSPSANQQDYQYVVVVNSLPGCQIVVNAPVVTVVTDPVVTLSIDNPIICQGGQSTLTVDVQGGIAGQNGIDPYSYAWYSNNNTETPFAVTNTNFYVLPTNLETDSFAYWVEVSANTYGCATTSAHVNQLVVADPIVNIIVAPTYPETVCDGGNTMLVATVQGGFGENSYQWYRNETILVGETNPTLNTGILSVNDINSYRVIVTQTGSGCETVSDTFQVPVIPTYDVVVSALNNATVCEGGTTTMEATITNTILPNDNPTFQWYEIIDGANVAIAGANSTRYTTSPLLTDGNHTYFVAVTSQITGSGCSSHSNSFYTSIVDDPVVTVTTTAINNVVCEGDVVHVNATVAPAGGNYTYNWTWTNGTNTYTYTNNEPTFAPTDLPASINGYLFNVSIVSTDANSGCNATSNNNAYVTVMPRPVVTITADNEVVCAGGHVVLTANHNASDYTGFNYAWKINGTNMASTLQTITVPASMVTAGTINASVIVTSSQLTLNCTSTASLTQPVQVLAQPTISLSADHLTMCAGAAPTLTATVNGNSINTPMTFVWKRNGSIINGATGSVYQSEPLNAGTYNFQVMALSENTDLNCNSDWSADNAVVVRVAETPVVSIASADGTLDLCEGGNITLTATVINANNTIGDFTNGSIYGAYNYVWNRDNNVVATNNNITLPQNQITETLNTYGYYTYNVNLTPVGALAFGCGSVMAENPVVVNVHLRPNWDAAVVSAHDGNICLGEEVQLHAHITGGVADMNGNTNGHIQWVVEFNGVASNVSNYGGDATHTPTVPGVYTYYPTYVAYEGSIIGSGCAFTSSNDQVSTFVTVHALPTAAFVSGDGSIICANVSDDNAALTIHFTGTPPFHFTVDDLSNGTSVMYDSYTNDYVIYVNPNHTTQYRITYLSDNYCSNGELGLDAIATIFVNDIQFEETFFQAECGEDVVTISFNMLSGTPNSDFTVTYDNGMVVNGTISNNTATFATPSIPGDYHAVFTVGGCDYDIIVRRPVGVNDFSDGSTPFMMQRWDDVVIINNNPATNGGHTFVSYQWYRNGVAIPGAIYKNYQEIGGLNGYYSIEVVSQDADGRTVTYRTCDQFFSSSSAIRVYPVPANVQQVVTVEIDMTAEELEGATLDIYDVTGSLVEHVTTVDPVTYLSGFKASGTYFGRLMMANGETKTVKFVIVK